jgi:hypothetical protein
MTTQDAADTMHRLGGEIQGTWVCPRCRLLRVVWFNPQGSTLRQVCDWCQLDWILTSRDVIPYDSD